MDFIFLGYFLAFGLVTILALRYYTQRMGLAQINDFIHGKEAELNHKLLSGFTELEDISINLEMDVKKYQHLKDNFNDFMGELERRKHHFDDTFKRVDDFSKTIAGQNKTLNHANAKHEDLLAKLRTSADTMKAYEKQISVLRAQLTAMQNEGKEKNLLHQAQVKKFEENQSEVLRDVQQKISNKVIAEWEKHEKSFAEEMRRAEEKIAKQLHALRSQGQEQEHVFAADLQNSTKNIQHQTETFLQQEQDAFERGKIELTEKIHVQLENLDDSLHEELKRQQNELHHFRDQIALAGDLLSPYEERIDTLELRLDTWQQNFDEKVTANDKSQKSFERDKNHFLKDLFQKQAEVINADVAVSAKAFAQELDERCHEKKLEIDRLANDAKTRFSNDFNDFLASAERIRKVDEFLTHHDAAILKIEQQMSAYDAQSQESAHAHEQRLAEKLSSYEKRAETSLFQTFEDQKTFLAKQEVAFHDAMKASSVELKKIQSSSEEQFMKVVRLQTEQAVTNINKQHATKQQSAEHSAEHLQGLTQSLATQEKSIRSLAGEVFKVKTAFARETESCMTYFKTLETQYDQGLETSLTEASELISRMAQSEQLRLKKSVGTFTKDLKQYKKTFKQLEKQAPEDFLTKWKKHQEQAIVVLDKHGAKIIKKIDYEKKSLKENENFKHALQEQSTALAKQQKMIETFQAKTVPELGNEIIHLRDEVKDVSKHLSQYEKIAEHGEVYEKDFQNLMQDVTEKVHQRIETFITYTDNAHMKVKTSLKLTEVQKMQHAFETELKQRYDAFIKLSDPKHLKTVVHGFKTFLDTQKDQIEKFVSSKLNEIPDVYLLSQKIDPLLSLEQEKQKRLSTLVGNLFSLKNRSPDRETGIYTQRLLQDFENRMDEKLKKIDKIHVFESNFSKQAQQVQNDLSQYLVSSKETLKNDFKNLYHDFSEKTKAVEVAFDERLAFVQTNEAKQNARVQELEQDFIVNTKKLEQELIVNAGKLEKQQDLYMDQAKEAIHVELSKVEAECTQKLLDKAEVIDEKLALVIEKGEKNINAMTEWDKHLSQQLTQTNKKSLGLVETAQEKLQGELDKFQNTLHKQTIGIQEQLSLNADTLKKQQNIQIKQVEESIRAGLNKLEAECQQTLLDKAVVIDENLALVIEKGEKNLSAMTEWDKHLHQQLTQTNKKSLGFVETAQEKLQGELDKFQSTLHKQTIGIQEQLSLNAETLLTLEQQQDLQIKQVKEAIHAGLNKLEAECTQKLLDKAVVIDENLALVIEKGEKNLSAMTERDKHLHQQLTQTNKKSLGFVEDAQKKFQGDLDKAQSTLHKQTQELEKEFVAHAKKIEKDQHLQINKLQTSIHAELSKVEAECGQKLLNQVQAIDEKLALVIEKGEKNLSAMTERDKHLHQQLTQTNKKSLGFMEDAQEKFQGDLNKFQSTLHKQTIGIQEQLSLNAETLLTLEQQQDLQINELQTSIHAELSKVEAEYGQKLLDQGQVIDKNLALVIGKSEKNISAMGEQDKRQHEELITMKQNWASIMEETQEKLQSDLNKSQSVLHKQTQELEKEFVANTKKIEEQQDLQINELQTSLHAELSKVEAEYGQKLLDQGQVIDKNLARTIKKSETKITQMGEWDKRQHEELITMKQTWDSIMEETQEKLQSDLNEYQNALHKQTQELEKEQNLQINELKTSLHAELSKVEAECGQKLLDQGQVIDKNLARSIKKSETKITQMGEADKRQHEQFMKMKANWETLTDKAQQKMQIHFDKFQNSLQKQDEQASTTLESMLVHHTQGAQAMLSEQTETLRTEFNGLLLTQQDEFVGYRHAVIAEYTATMNTEIKKEQNKFLELYQQVSKNFNDATSKLLKKETILLEGSRDSYQKSLEKLQQFNYSTNAVAVMERRQERLLELSEAYQNKLKKRIQEMARSKWMRHEIVEILVTEIEVGIADKARRLEARLFKLPTLKQELKAELKEELSKIQRVPALARDFSSTYLLATKDRDKLLAELTPMLSQKMAHEWKAPAEEIRSLIATQQNLAGSQKRQIEKLVRSTEKNMEAHKQTLITDLSQRLQNFEKQFKVLAQKMNAFTAHTKVFTQMQELSSKLSSGLARYEKRFTKILSQEKNIGALEKRFQNLLGHEEKAIMLADEIKTQQKPLLSLSTRLEENLSLMQKLQKHSEEIKHSQKLFSEFANEIKAYEPVVSQFKKELAAMPDRNALQKEIHKLIKNFRLEQGNISLGNKKLETSLRLIGEREETVRTKFRALETQAEVLESHYKDFKVFDEKYNQLDYLIEDIEQRKRSVEDMRRRFSMEREELEKLKKDFNDQISMVLKALYQKDSASGTKTKIDKLTTVERLNSLGWSKREIADHLNMKSYEVEVILKQDRS